MNYFVFKETAQGAYIIVNDINKFISKEFSKFTDVANLAKEYNNIKDVQRRKAIIDEVEEILSTKLLTKLVASGDFSVDAQGRLYYNGISKPIPFKLAEYFREALKNGIDVQPYTKFWENLQLNPNEQSQVDLFGFLEHNGHPITTNGYFLAYKAVNVKKKFDTKTGKEVKVIEYDEDSGKEVKQPYTQELVYTSIHSGPYGGTIKIGEPVSMPREKCDENPNQTCSFGLHVGSMQYVKQFANRDSVVLEVLVNPRNVVAVPKDYNNTKMRVCEYYPIAISNGENKNVYLESDYINYDKGQLAKELQSFEKAKQDTIDELEKKLEAMKIAAGLIKQQ